jgi:hypothetical protein
MIMSGRETNKKTKKFTILPFKPFPIIPFCSSRRCRLISFSPPNDLPSTLLPLSSIRKFNATRKNMNTLKPNLIQMRCIWRRLLIVAIVQKWFKWRGNLLISENSILKKATLVMVVPKLLFSPILYDLNFSSWTKTRSQRIERKIIIIIIQNDIFCLSFKYVYLQI